MTHTISHTDSKTLVEAAGRARNTPIISFNRMAQAFRASIRNQLSGITVAMALIPVLVVSIFIGVLTITRIRATLQANALSQLEQVRTLKSEQLTAFFAEREGNVKLNSQTQTTLDALTSFTDGFNAAGANTVRPLYLDKPDIVNAGDDSAYTAAHRQFASYLASLHSTFGFYDVFLINRSGQIVYSYAKEDDFGTNLVSGPYANTKLAEVFQAALKLKQGETVLSDFAFYAPSGGAPAAFRSAPIYDSGRVVGVFAVQVPLDRITAIMQERTGLGETGETFLVGTDKLFRSESLFTKDSLLKVKVDTISSNSALAGKTGSGPITDYRDLPVFAAWQPVKIGDLQWAFIAKIDESEALATANQLTTFITASVSVAGLIVVVLALIVSFSVSRSFVQPILQLRDFALEAAAGKLDISIQSDRVDELGVLASAFNSMTSQLKATLEGLNRRAAELATVAKVSASVATILETDKLLSEVVNLTKEQFNLYHSHIYLLNEAGDTLVLAAGAGDPGKQMVTEGRSIPLNREQSLVARAARERQGVIVNDVTNAPDFLANPLLPDTRSELAVPLIVGDKVLGVFDVQADKVDRFTPEDVNIQITLASQIAVAIQNARQYEQTLATAAELTGIQGAVSEAAIVAITDVQGKIEQVNDNLVRISKYSREELIGQDHRLLNSGYHPKEFMRDLWVTIANGKVWRSEIQNRAKDGLLYWVDTTIAPILNERGKPVKYMAVRFDITARKQAEETIAQRASELATVARVSSAAATILDADKLLLEVANLTKEQFALYHSHIYLLNEAGDTLVLAAGAGEAGKQMVAEGRSILLNREQSLVARAARERQGIIVNNVQAEPDFLPNPLLPNTRSELAVPLIVGDRVLGVFDVQSDKVDRFTPEDVNIQTTLASQIAVALQNVRAFSQAQRQAEREAMLNAISQKIQSATTVDVVLQIAARELGRALGAPLTIAQLGMKDSNN